MPTGSVFNEDIKSVIGDQDVKTITFVTESQLTGGTRIGNSRAYALVEGTTLKVYTSENKFKFNADCSSMFGGLMHITKIDWGNSFSTYGVGDMSYMFSGCEKLTSVNFPYDEDEEKEKFSVFGVSTMEGMFKNCKAVQELDLYNFAFGRISNLSGMFKNCNQLTSISVDSVKFKTNTVLDMSSMFEGCSALTSVPTLQTNWVTNMSNMYKGCKALTDVPSLQTNSVTNMSSMFEGCEALTNFDVQWSGKKSVDMSGMFDGCSKLTKVAFGSNFKPTATGMSYMFNQCIVLTYIDLRNFTVEDSTNCENMFSFLAWGSDYKAQIYVTDELKKTLSGKGNTAYGETYTSAEFNTGTPPASN